jgi:hypothetical protein
MFVNVFLVCSVFFVFLAFLVTGHGTGQITTGAELDWRENGGAELGGAERYPTEIF